MRLRCSLTGCFLALGLAFRLVHFLRSPSVWHDEAALLLNVIGKNFGELLGPLYFAEAAPPLFLWLERVVFLLLGDGTTAMRLLPFLASCTSLLLLAWTARRVLVPAAVPWAVLLFAASDRLLWHCCEAKPYAVDMLVAASVLALSVAGGPARLRAMLLLCAAVAPVFILLSYPACFVLGALLVVFLVPVARDGRPGSWAAYGLLVATVFGAFAFLALGPAHAQRHPELDHCWLTHFPPLHEPWRVPVWILFSSLDMFRYCFEPTGPVLAVLAVFGAVFLWRSDRRSVVVVAALPPVLALLASFAGAYPYGGSRVEAFAAPGLALLIAAGAAAAATSLPVRAGRLCLAALLLVPAAQTAFHVVHPWRRADNAGAAAYVQARCRAGDAVASNVWQDQYYFRREPAFELLRDRPLEPGRRQWIVVTSWPHSFRDELVAHFTHSRTILDRRDFTDITVVLLAAN